MAKVFDIVIQQNFDLTIFPRAKNKGSGKYA